MGGGPVKGRTERRVPFWKRRDRHLHQAATELARNGGRRIKQLAANGKQTAANAGREMARHVLGVQKAARLEHKLMERSLQSVTNPRITGDWEQTLQGDSDWRQGYAEVAIPVLAKHEAALDAMRYDAEPVSVGPVIPPSWPQKNPNDPDKEAGN
jgi:hypothetical protein